MHRPRLSRRPVLCLAGGMLAMTTPFAASRRRSRHRGQRRAARRRRQEDAGPAGGGDRHGAARALLVRRRERWRRRLGRAGVGLPRAGPAARRPAAGRGLRRRQWPAHRRLRQRPRAAPEGRPGAAPGARAGAVRPLVVGRGRQRRPRRAGRWSSTSTGCCSSSNAPPRRARPTAKGTGESIFVGQGCVVVHGRLRASDEGSMTRTTAAAERSDD